MTTNDATTSTTGLTSFVLRVIYNGTEKPLHDVKPNEEVATVLQRALKLFDIRDRHHVFALFTLAGQEIANNQTVQQAGLGPDSQILLREKTVVGG